MKPNLHQIPVDRSLTDATRLPAKPLECGEFSPLSAGALSTLRSAATEDGSPARVVSRSFLPGALAAAVFPRRSVRRGLADQPAKPEKRRRVAALQSGAAAWLGDVKSALGFLVAATLILLTGLATTNLPAQTPLQIAQQAYLKASNTGAGDEFSAAVAVSGDTVVVGATGEASNASGVNGNQANNSLPYAGAAYVFVRDGTNWLQQAYLKASNPDSEDLFGAAVAIHGDTIVVGAWGEDSSATGVNGDQNNNGALDSGAAYVFVRDGTNWTQQAYLKASNTGQPDPNFGNNDDFGMAVAISGDTIIVGAFGEASNATGINGDQANNSARLAGAAYVFVRNGTNWSQQAYLKASNTEAGDEFGFSVAVSGDTAVVGAVFERSNAVGVDGDQFNNFAPDSGAAYVFLREGTNWSQQAYLKASNTDAGDGFGQTMSISDDTIIAGALGESSGSDGVNGDQSDNSVPNSGAVYVFAREGEAWTQQAYLKASNPDEYDNFGWSLGVSGHTIVVGSPWENSSATGVNGNQTNSSAPESGAAYVFARNGTNWTQQGYLKASNAQASDQFGWSVAVSGNSVVASAPVEASSATGVNGDQSNNAAAAAGAAYVFTIAEARPQLSIARTAPDTLTISWPSPSTGWNLEQNPTLTGGTWTTPPEPIDDNGVTKSITVNTATGSRFFRLKSN
jgi:hypothetical protein